MFDELRRAVEETTKKMAGLDRACFNATEWQVGVAELRRALDAQDAEYGRMASSVDVSWMAQATGSTVQRAKHHATVGAAMEVSPALAEAVRAGEIALENVAVLSAVAAHPEFEASSLLDAATVMKPSKLRAEVEQWHAKMDRDADENHAQTCHRRRSLKFFRTLEGMVRIEGLLEVEAGRIVRNAVDDLVRTQRLDNTGRTPEQRRADAIVELAAGPIVIE
jgi:hypothetical protein